MYRIKHEDAMKIKCNYYDPSENYDGTIGTSSYITPQMVFESIKANFKPSMGYENREVERRATQSIIQSIPKGMGYSPLCSKVKRVGFHMQVQVQGVLYLNCKAIENLDITTPLKKLA